MATLDTDDLNAIRAIQRTTLDFIESQRGHHTWSGNIFYVAPVNGNDTTGDGSRALPYKTVTKALSMCVANNHDVIFLLPDDTVSPTVLTEDIVVNKSYTFIRGPGRDFKLQSTAGASRTAVSIQAHGVELGGVIMGSNGTAGTPLKVAAADFAYIHDVFIESPTQDCIEINVGTNTRIENCVLTGAARDGIRISSGAGAGYYTSIQGNVIRDVLGSAVNLVGTDASEARIQRNIIRDNVSCITVGTGVADTVITDNRMINNTNPLTDNGTRTLVAFNSEITAAQITDAVWDEVISPSFHNVKNSAAYKLWRNADTMIHSGIAQGPGSLGVHNQIQLDTAASAVDGAYDPALVFIVAGTGAGQSRNILQYAGATRTATVDRGWKVDPAADSEFIVLSDAGREHTNEGLAQGGGTDTIILNPQASDHDDCYNAQLVFLRSGPGEDQARRILDYEGATRTATVSRPWVAGHEPTSGTAYVVLPTGAISDNCIGRAVWSDHHGDYAGDLLSAAARLNALLLAGSYTAPNNSGITDIKAITDQIRFTIANQVDAHILSGGEGDGAVSQAQLDALLLAFGALAASTFAGGSVENPTAVKGERDVVIFTNTDYDAIEFNVGPQWSTYLNEADAVPWFTVKEDPRKTTNLIDAPAVISDPDKGLITLSLTAAQTAVKAGTFYWQLRLVRTIVTGTPPDEVTSYKKRMLMEGKVYIKPTFKV